MNKDEQTRVNAMYSEAMQTVMAAHNRSGTLAAQLASVTAERDALQAELAALKAPKESNVVPMALE